MSRSGSFGTMPAGAARRRRRLISVMRLASTDCVLGDGRRTRVSRSRTLRTLARVLVARGHQRAELAATKTTTCAANCQADSLTHVIHEIILHSSLLKSAAGSRAKGLVRQV